jgi:uncharacterized membrane protein HdeD (DUF308 family)
MAETCKGMMDKPGSSVWMMIPGIIFIALGILIIFCPQVLASLVAIALILVGIAMLVMINFVRGTGKRFQNKSE